MNTLAFRKDNTMQRRIAIGSLDMGRIGIGFQAVGLAQVSSMEETIQYAKQRVAFGQPISHYQAIQFMIADMSSHIEAAACFCARPPFSATGAGLTPVSLRIVIARHFLK